MRVQDLSTLPYRDAWAIQEQVHADVLGGGEERLILVEHPPVITFGRRAETFGQQNLVASQDYLKQLGVELVQSDRGGDITFHGPGQIVAYPIIRLIDHHLSVGGYVRKLEEIVIATLAELGIAAKKDDAGVGVWVEEKQAVDSGQQADSSSFILQPSTFPSAKICAIGVRVRRGVTMHGIALNVETDLRYFDLIVPCGLAGKRATSVRKILGLATPPIADIKQTLGRHFAKALALPPRE